MDLRDYQITSAVSKNFQTKGRFVIEQGGYVFNTETTASEIVIKGKFLGKLYAENTLEIHSTADLKGTFKAGKLIIPAGQRFNWLDNFTVRDAEISGECVARVAKANTIILKSSARFFGDIISTNLVIESGAVLVGTARIGVKEPATKPAKHSLAGFDK